MSEKRAAGRVRIFAKANLITSLNDHQVNYNVSVFDVSKTGIGLMSSIELMMTPMYELVFEGDYEFYRMGRIQNSRELKMKVKRYGFEFTRPLSDEEYFEMVEALAVI